MTGKFINRSAPVDEGSLRGLHPSSISDPIEIRQLLERARDNHSVFHRGLNRHVDLEIATLSRIEDGELVFSAPNFDCDLRRQIFLNFTVSGRPFFFASIRCAPIENDRLVVQIPKEIFYSERRDRLRRAPDTQEGDSDNVRVHFNRKLAVRGVLADLSAGGLAVLIDRAPPATSSELLNVEFLDGRTPGSRVTAQLRNAQPIANPPGWVRIGLLKTTAKRIQEIEIENWKATGDDLDELRHKAPVDTGITSIKPNVLRFLTTKGEEIVGLVDSWGDPRGATAVIVPSGWGQTKEALLRLARTIVTTFAAARLPICVVRFDGIRKRGESYNDPSCQIPGREYLHYVFSQGADDIEEVARFLRESPMFGISSIVIVSFSAAAIEARKALARDQSGMINGWISVAGSPDVQSMTRAISGGVDFASGLERKIYFGVQELLSVAVDIDRIVRDGTKNSLLFIEDARNDMAIIDVPITWYHGRYDAWVDGARVRDILSHGNSGNRRLILLPTGHQLKDSRQAGLVFQRIACEVGRIIFGRALKPRAEQSSEINLIRRRERARLPSNTEDLQEFWRDYLIGRDRSYGIELLTNSDAYQDLMEMQIDFLMIADGDRILDLGSGVGTFPIQLARNPECPRSINIASIDYVREALHRAKNRLESVDTRNALSVSYIGADLDLLHGEHRIPVKSGIFDVAIGSLLISYLENPILLLHEIYRALRPGGRVVISSLCRDADISKLYTDSVAELNLRGDDIELPGFDRSKLAGAARNFLNDAAKILDLEEAGAFHFWEKEELGNLVEDAGFSFVREFSSLGKPPQAVVVAAKKGLVGR